MDTMKFNEIYMPGDIVWYVKINNLTGTKELVSGRVRTTYANVLILTDEENNGSHVIDISEADRIFRDERSARELLQSITITAQFGGQS